MRKKIVGIFVCVMFLICGISYSVTSFSYKINSRLDDDKLLINTGDPLMIRAEVQQIGYRIWLLKAYLKNNWDEKIFVKSNLPCCFSIRYNYPDLDDFNILVFYPFRGLLPQLIPVFHFFKPGEEKLVGLSIFCGISNYIIPLLADNITEYIEDFPILPEGDYIFEAIINPYYVDDCDSQFGVGLKYDTAVFHLAAPK